MLFDADRDLVEAAENWQAVRALSPAAEVPAQKPRLLPNKEAE